MNNFGIAVKYALNDFFRRQVNHGTFVEAWDRRKNYSVFSYDELCLVTVLAGVHKHTFAVPGSIIEAIKEGKWKYDVLKDVENRAPSILANSGLSPDGQKLALKTLRQGKGVDAQRFSRDDAKILARILDTSTLNTRENVHF